MLEDPARSTQPPELADAMFARYAGFAAWLRENDFHVTSSDMAAAAEIAYRTGQFNDQLLRGGLRACLCSRAEEWRRFDDLFEAYFFTPNRHALVEANAGGTGRLTAPGEDRAQDRSEGMPLSLVDTGDDTSHADGITAEHGASRHTSIMNADFRHLNQPDELFAIDEAIRRFVQRLRGMQIRRERRAPAGRAIDMARTIRLSVAHGGVPLELAWRRKQRVRPRIVMLLDVSRSMSLYSFFFLRLARVVSAHLSDVHCFVFHTRLTGIAQALRDPDPWRCQERLQLLSAGWAGGTRIGDSLDEFNQRHATALLHSRTAVVIVSDGYDAGEPARLQQALQRIKSRCKCIAWLNPLAGRPGFTPVSVGMAAAMPYLDLMTGVSDLASLERVLPHILSVLQ